MSAYLIRGAFGRPVVAVCACGRTYDQAEFRALEYVGPQCDEVEHLELRNCVCGSTIAAVAWRAPEAP